MNVLTFWTIVSIIRVSMRKLLNPQVRLYVVARFVRLFTNFCYASTPKLKTNEIQMNFVVVEYISLYRIELNTTEIMFVNSIRSIKTY